MTTHTSRRRFLKWIAYGTVVSALVIDLVLTNEPRPEKTLTEDRIYCRRCSPEKPCNECKEKIIAKILSTEEGRKALANALVEPIRKTPEYAR